MESFSKFKEKALRKKDAIVPILFFDPISSRLVYGLKRMFPKMTPTDITVSRLLFFSPLVLLFLFLAPFYGDIFYLLAGIGFYITLLTDCMDGQLARGTGQISKKGDLLDCISDRFSNIVFFTLLFSFGLRIGSYVLVIGSFCLLILKIFQMMIVIRVTESNFFKKSSPDKYLSEEGIADRIGVNFIYKVFFKIISPLKIKRIDPRRSCLDQYIITIIVPSILIFFKLILVVKIFLYILLVFFIVFYSYKIGSLINSILRTKE
jgi:phosphatidylglycerophosphate synthase